MSDHRVRAARGTIDFVKPQLLDTPPKHNPVFVLLALITLAGAALRLYQSLDVLWVDELHTSWVVAGDLADVSERARIGNQSPLYFYVVWCSIHLFGMNEIALRLPSLIAGIALVPVSYLAVKRWTASSVAALLAAALVALERDFVFYASEARPYAGVQLVALIQLMLFVGLVERDVLSATRWWKPNALRLGFAASTTLLFYLHYTTALLIAGEVVCYVILVVARPQTVAHRPASFVVDLLLIAAVCSPAIPHLLEISARREQWESVAEHWPSTRMIRMFAVYVASPIVLAGSIIGVRCLVRLRPRVRAVNWRAALCAVCWTLTPLAIAWLSTTQHIAQLSLFRYLIGMAAGMMILAGFFCALVPSRGLRIAVSLLVLAAAIATNDMFYYARTMFPQYQIDRRLMADRSEDWHGAADFIIHSGTPNWPVFLCSNLVEDGALRDSPPENFVEYCTFPLRGMYRVEAEVIPISTVGPDRFGAAHLQNILEQRGAWLVVRGPNPLVAEIVWEIVHQMPADVRWLIDVRQTFGNVHVVRLAIEAG